MRSRWARNAEEMPPNQNGVGWGRKPFLCVVPRTYSRLIASLKTTSAEAQQGRACTCLANTHGATACNSPTSGTCFSLKIKGVGFCKHLALDGATHGHWLEMHFCAAFLRGKGGISERGKGRCGACLINSATFCFASDSLVCLVCLVCLFCLSLSFLSVLLSCLSFLREKQLSF